jgi:hypothetical protein
MSLITSAWVLTPASVVVYLAGWLSWATLWTRNELGKWVYKNPHASQRQIAEQRAKEARDMTALALTWPITMWLYLAFLAGDKVPPLVARWSRHPLELPPDLRETSGRQQ